MSVYKYNLDPSWYYTAPDLAWGAALKKKKVKLELLSDRDILLMFEHGIRGGITSASKRCGQANNKYMGEKYDAEKPFSYISYLDASNLYGWAMSQELPTHGFKWMTKSELDNWKGLPCIVEVDLEYPAKLHDLHNDYPLAAEEVKIKEVAKLISNLRNKKKYIAHYENLRYYESLSFKITKIHRDIKFKESVWLKNI